MAAEWMTKAGMTQWLNARILGKREKVFVLRWIEVNGCPSKCPISFNLNFIWYFIFVPNDNRIYSNHTKTKKKVWSPMTLEQNRFFCCCLEFGSSHFDYQVHGVLMIILFSSVLSIFFLESFRRNNLIAQMFVFINF